ncbi:MAG: response regulator [Thiohalocapsa sp.]|uniref:response regulator n=1 Tax=Thiohalocapsa sp. TaxID=2497641 RepID=UPI0025DCE409|nr:response regulator [Thiohalocapsa sp.]MCG6940666.1 response regulator [Thiohalocapsa sp.]
MQQPFAELPVSEPSSAGLPHADILLIDASAAARYALRLKLKALGAEVRQASSVEQALPALRARRPDLIITAPVLPGMNALELLELLRPAAGGDAPPLVIHRWDADWPLAGAAEARGAVTVSTDAELLRLLPTLLRRGSGNRTSAALPTDLATAHAPAADLRQRLPHQPCDEPAATTQQPARQHEDSCWRLALMTALAGLLVGAWIGWL